MLVDLVNCTNCGSTEIKIVRGGEVCPRCFAIGCLTWSNDSQEVEADSYEDIQFHDYEPTDTEGHSMECVKCGDFTTIWSEEDDNKEFITDDAELYRNLFEIYGPFCSNFYTLKGSSVVYVETCNKQN